MTDLVDLTVVEAGDQLRRRTASCRDLTEAVLQRISETEPRIHAYTHVYDESSLVEADRLDRELAGGRMHGPLHGIPVAVKDLLWTTDAPTTAGSRVLAGYMAPVNAAIVDRLRTGGAIIVGKTVTHEFAYGVNEPPTRNAWDAERYPGGSSAGSGAAVAARSAFAAIGTDTGGSIREPAALHGLAGMKATFGLVSRYGVVPLSHSLDHAGPMCRTVEDCALLLGQIAGYDPRDPGSIDEPVPDYLQGIDGDVRGLRIGVERDFHFPAGITAEVRNAVEQAINDFRALGATIVDVALPQFHTAGVIGLTILLADASAIHRKVLREKADLLDPGTRVMLELGEFVPAAHYALALQARTVLRDAVRSLYQSHGLDALLSPTTASTTLPMHAIAVPDESGRDPMSSGIDLTFTANVVGLPALTIPCGFSSDGFPISLQLMGRPFDEKTVFRLAQAYERSHDWTARKPLFPPAND